MDILKRSGATIKEAAGVDERAKEVLKSRLTARRVGKVLGPRVGNSSRG